MVLSMRERILAAYCGHNPDVVPFMLNLSHWFYHNNRSPWDLAVWRLHRKNKFVSVHIAGRLGELANAYNVVSSHISGPLLGIFLLAVLSKGTTAEGVLVGAGSGILTIFVLSLNTKWSFFYLGPIRVIVTLIAGSLSRLFMKPPGPEKIRGFVLGQGKVLSLRDREGT